MNVTILSAKPDITALEQQCLDENGFLKPVPMAVYEKAKHEQLGYFGHSHGFYSFPTFELLEWLKQELDLSEIVIEIGAGDGVYGRALGIRSTDSKIQDTPEVANYYKMMRQPIIKYGPNVHQLDALSAIDAHNPHTVLASWVTHFYNEKNGTGSSYGVDEGLLLQRVKKYILIGNDAVHRDKPIMALPHKTYRFPFLYSRCSKPDQNFVKIWDMEWEA